MGRFLPGSSSLLSTRVGVTPRGSYVLWGSRPSCPPGLGTRVEDRQRECRRKEEGREEGDGESLVYDRKVGVEVRVEPSERG